MTNEVTAIVPATARLVAGPDEAWVTVTYKEADTFDLPRPVPFTHGTKEQWRAWAQEMMRTGGIPGRPMDLNADLSNFSVEPVPRDPTHPGGLDFNRVLIRPKTDYGC